MDETDRAIEIAKREVWSETRRVLNAVAIKVNQTLITSTPVDTGRARANWLVGLQNPVTSKKQESYDKEGLGTIASNNAVINSNKKAYTDIYISNNLEYIDALNNGHSAQAPAGFVEKAVQAARQIENEL